MCEGVGKGTSLGMEISISEGCPAEQEKVAGTSCSQRETGGNIINQRASGSHLIAKRVRARHRSPLCFKAQGLDCKSSWLLQASTCKELISKPLRQGLKYLKASQHIEGGRAKAHSAFFAHMLVGLQKVPDSIAGNAYERVLRWKDVRERPRSETRESCCQAA